MRIAKVSTWVMGLINLLVKSPLQVLLSLMQIGGLNPKPCLADVNQTVSPERISCNNPNNLFAALYPRPLVDQ